MSTPEPTSGVPVWARKRRKPAHPLVNWVLVPLALFGVLTAGLAVREKSFAAAGARLDGWMALARDRVQGAAPSPAAKPVKPKPVAKAVAAPIKPVDAVAAPATSEPAAPAPAPAPIVGQSGRIGG